MVLSGIAAPAAVPDFFGENLVRDEPRETRRHLI
jgi:hypothetical protein